MELNVAHQRYNGFCVANKNGRFQIESLATTVDWCMQAVVREASLRWYCVLSVDVVRAHTINLYAVPYSFSHCHSLHLHRVVGLCATSSAIDSKTANGANTKEKNSHHRSVESTKTVGKKSPHKITSNLTMKYTKRLIPMKLFEFQMVVPRIEQKPISNKNYSQNHPCWILNRVYACTNDASSPYETRFVLTSLASFYRTIRIVFMFICSNFMYDVCAAKQIDAGIETYVSTHVSQSWPKEKLKQKSNQIQPIQWHAPESAHLHIEHDESSR